MDGDSSDSDENRNNMNCLIYEACLNRFADCRYAFLCFNRFVS